MSRLAWPFVRSRTTLASRSSRNARSRAVRVRDAPRAHFSLLPSRSARADLRPTPRRPRADRPPTCPRLPRPVRVVLTAQTRHEAPTVLALALVPKLVDEPRPARPRCTSRYSSSSRRPRCTFSCVFPQPVCSRTSRRVKRTSLAPTPCALATSVTITSTRSSSLRVCGGSSSRLRPSTSSASRFAIAMSSRVTSMYSTRRPACSTLFTSRWYWCRSATVRISVRYFM